MHRFVVLATAGLALAGCQTLTPDQAALYAKAFCVVSADGAVLAVSITKGGAQDTARKIADAQPVVCDAATKLGTVLTVPAK